MIINSTDDLFVTKRDGTLVPYNIDKIHRIVEIACEGITGVSVSDIEMNAHLSFYNKMPTVEIHRAITKAAFNLIDEQNPNYQFVAGRLLNYDMRKSAWGGMNPPKLYDFIKNMIKAGYYTNDLITMYDEKMWTKLEAIVDHDRDLGMTYIGVKEFMTKYAMRDRSLDEVVPLETPQLAYILIAALQCSDRRDFKSIKSFYNDLSQGNISMPTPIMAGLRSTVKQFSSCFPGESLVWTDVGMIPIKDISIGDKVLTQNGQYNRVLATDKKISGERMVSFDAPYMINGEFSCTENHKIFGMKKYHPSSVKNYNFPEWIYAKDLEKSDFVHIPFNKDINPQKFITISDFVDLNEINYEIDETGLIRKLTVDPAHRSSRYDNRCKGVENEITLTPEFLRLLGYYLAEGYSGPDCVSLTFNANETEFIEDVKNICRSTFSELYLSVNSNEKDNSIKLVLHSISLALFFKAIVGSGFNKKFINDFIMKLPYELQEQLLIGVMRGDGCVHKNGVTLGMSNRNLIMQLAQIMLRGGLYPTLAKKLPTETPTGIKQFSAKEVSFSIFLGSSGNYHFIEMIGKGIMPPKRKLNRGMYSKYLNGEYFVRIRNVNITSPTVDPVYDIQVDNNQSFTVNGVCVHNCVLIDCDDTLDSIFATSAAIGKYIARKAGIGIDLSAVRAEGSSVNSGAIKHTGVIPFYRLMESSVKSCSQGGVRGGAATLHTMLWHYEIEDILVLKNNKGTPDNRVRKLDYSIQINNYLYKRLVDMKDITLFSPNDVPDLYDAFFSDQEKFAELYEKYERSYSIRKKKISAKDLFTRLMLERKETGRIYIFNVDNVNDHGSFNVPLKMSNLCVSGETGICVKFDGKESNIMISELGALLDKYTVSVKSFNIDANDIEYNEITAFALMNDSADVMKITDDVSGKYIICTPDHKIYTKNRGYVMASALLETDTLLLD